MKIIQLNVPLRNWEDGMTQFMNVSKVSVSLDFFPHF